LRNRGRAANDQQVNDDEVLHLLQSPQDSYSNRMQRREL
jgi:hypothetical protein